MTQLPTGEVVLDADDQHRVDLFIVWALMQIREPNSFTVDAISEFVKDWNERG